MKQCSSVTWILLAILLAAAGLRTYKCFQWPLDGDEIYTLHNSRVIHWGIDPDELTGRIYALCPVSFYLNRPLVDSGAADEMAIRLVPLLAGIAACALLGWLAIAEFGRIAGLSATVLLTLNPYHVEMSQYGRYYSLVFLLANLSLILLLRAVRTGSLPTLLFSQAILLLAVASHLPAAFLLPGELIYLLIAWKWGGCDRQQRNKLLLGMAVVLLAHGALLIYLIPAVGLWSSVQQAGARSPLELVLGWTVGAGLGVVVLNVGGALYLLRLDDRRVWLPLIAQVVPCAALLGMAIMGKTVMPQFTGYVYFAMFLVCGLVIDRLIGQLRQTGPRRSMAVFFGVVVLLLAMLPSLPSLASHYVDGNRHDFRQCAKLLVGYSSKGSVICSSWPHVFAYHARREGNLKVVELSASALSDAIFAESSAGKLVVLPLEALGKVAVASRQKKPGVDIVAVVKIERDGRIANDNSNVIQGVLMLMCRRFDEISAARYDHRRNRLDVYAVNQVGE